MHPAFRLLTGIAFASQVATAAQSYPAHPVRLVVPASPGGGSDAAARIIGQKLGEGLGQTLVIDNRPGAAEMLGTNIVAKSLPDGHTLILCDMPHAINGSVHQNVPYDAVRDFSPITLIGTTPLLLVAHPGVPAQSVKEFVTLAKAQPGRINLASGGNGTATHLVGELFKQRSGTTMTHVPYKGTGPALGEVIAGQIQSMFSTSPGAVPHVKATRLRALATTSAARAAALPDVPTLEESGFPGFVVTHWYGIMAPAGVPQGIIARLHVETVRAVGLPEVRERLMNVALDPTTNTPAQFKAFLEAEIKRWAKVVKDAGISPE
ncbi:MAG: tripartite tricarboxylate transporter substrate binding protein [Betaproteobacteria bacterium]|nr:tripartite tricarboxylate transporter substrate binding protein [Betaproteobacteria bacterium]